MAFLENLAYFLAEREAVSGGCSGAFQAFRYTRGCAIDSDVAVTSR